MMEMKVVDLMAQIGYLPSLAIAVALGFIIFIIVKRMDKPGSSAEKIQQPAAAAPTQAPVTGIHPGHIAAISAAVSQYQNEGRG